MKFCLITKVDQAEAGAVTNIRETVHKYNAEAKIVESIHQPRCFIPLAEWFIDLSSEGVSVENIDGKKIMAVSAIGNPASFERTLRDLGAEIIESIRYPDHHEYTVKEMQDVLKQADALGAESIVITEKDAVKIPGEFAKTNWSIPIFVICVEVKFQTGAAEFQNELRRRLSEKLGERHPK